MKFSQPFAVKVTAEQQEEIVPKLEALGYIKYWFQYSLDYIVTNIANHNEYVSDASTNHYLDNNRILLPYNKELILAIAAMNDGDYIVSEWVYAITTGNHLGDRLCYNSNSLYKVTSTNYKDIFSARFLRKYDKPFYDWYLVLDNKYDAGGWKADDTMRKATLTEILDHFGYYLDGREVKAKNKEVNSHIGSNANPTCIGCKHDGEWRCNHGGSCQDFNKYEVKLTQLPKYWCVLNDVSQRFKDTVLAFINSNHSIKYKGALDDWYYGYFNNGYDWHCIPGTATVLSIDEFIKLTNMKKEKKIIGYKCPCDLFSDDIKMGTLYKPLSSNNNTTYAATESNGLVTVSKYNLPKEIVEQWEPVYEDWKKQLKIGDWVWKKDDNKAIRISDACEGTGTYRACNYKVTIYHVTEQCPDLYPRLATTDEIQTTLINVAESKGFTKGVKVSRPHCSLTDTTIFGEITSVNKYRTDVNKLEYGGVFIYDNSDDTWATIISQNKEVDMGVYVPNANLSAITSDTRTVKCIAGKDSNGVACKWSLKKGDDYFTQTVSNNGSHMCGITWLQHIKEKSVGITHSGLNKAYAFEYTEVLLGCTKDIFSIKEIEWLISIYNKLNG